MGGMGTYLKCGTLNVAPSTPMYAIHDTIRIRQGVTIMRKAMVSVLLTTIAVLAGADYSVTEIDFLEKSGLESAFLRTCEDGCHRYRSWA